MTEPKDCKRLSHSVPPDEDNRQRDPKGHYTRIENHTDYHKI